MKKTTARLNNINASASQSVYKKTTLDNGIRIITETIPYVHSVSVGFWVNTGSRDESRRVNGISHFIEHMAFKGTNKYSSAQIAKQIEGYGGYLNAFTGKEATCYYSKILDEHIPRTVDVLSELVFNPKLKIEDIEKEKMVVLEEIKNIEDDPEEFIHDYFDEVLFQNHSAGNPVIGTAKTVREFQKDDIIQYLKTHYRAENIIVAAAGNIQHDELVSLIEKTSTDFKPQKHATYRRKPSAVKSKHALIRQDKPIQQAHICLGNISYSIKSKYRYPLVIMNTLIGEGMSSRLFQNIREKYGFSYSIGSFLNMLSDIGSFGVYTGTDKKNIQKSIDLIFKEFDNLKKYQVRNSELERVKSQVKGTIMLSLESMSSRMMRLATSEIYFNTYFTLESIIEHLDAVTSDDVMEVANKILNREKFSVVIFSPLNSK